MRKLQAALRDKAAKAWRESTVMYKVGSVFKGCHHCGDYEQDEDGGRKRYTSGHNVFRSYYPSRTKWTYWCWDCGAKDEAAWEGAADIGADAIRGSKEAIKNAKNRLRAQADRPERAARVAQVDPLEHIRIEIEKIKALLERRK